MPKACNYGQEAVGMFQDPVLVSLADTGKMRIWFRPDPRIKINLIQNKTCLVIIFAMSQKIVIFGITYQ